jgi:hypothetical protein
MSAWTANAASPISLAVSAFDSPSMSTHVKRAPSSANRIALAFPMPDPAPVTIVTLPSSRPLMEAPPLVVNVAAFASYRRQKAGVKMMKSVTTSSRPASMSIVKTSLAAGCTQRKLS